jgi:hypothetical protein
MTASPMPPKDRSEMAYLCEKIATEQDPEAFESIVQQLMELIERKRQRLRLENRRVF